MIFSGPAFHEFMAKFFTFPAKCWLIPYGIPAIDKPAEENPPAARVHELPTIGFIGGVGPRKGLNLVLKAIRKQPDILRSLRLQIIGAMADNWNYRELQSIQTEYPGCIEVLGRLSDEAMDRAMRRIDVALLPSWFETYNITLRELLLRGTPSIVTDTYGSEIVVSGVNGMVIPRGDGDALLAALQRLADDPALILRLREGARQTPVETLETECRKLVAVYRELLELPGC